MNPTELVRNGFWRRLDSIRTTQERDGPRLVRCATRDYVDVAMT